MIILLDKNTGSLTRLGLAFFRVWYYPWLILAINCLLNTANHNPWLVLWTLWTSCLFFFLCHPVSCSEKWPVWHFSNVCFHLEACMQSDCNLQTERFWSLLPWPLQDEVITNESPTCRCTVSCDVRTPLLVFFPLFSKWVCICHVLNASSVCIVRVFTISQQWASIKRQYCQRE